MHIGKCLKIAMAVKGKKGREVSHAMGIAPTYLSQRIQLPTCSTDFQDRFCKVLGITSSELAAMGE